MKNQIMAVIAAIGLMTGCATHESRMASLRSLPLPVQHTIREQAPHADIARVEKLNYEGRAVYDVSFHNPAMYPDLRIASDGTLLSGGRVMLMHEPAGAVYAPPVSVAPRTTLRFEDLPPAVQAAIRARAPNSKIVGIEKSVRTDVVYDVQVAEPAPSREFRVTQDGIIVE